MPPATAPGIEPKPPRTAAVKPLITMSPIFVERKTTGATSTPASAPTTAARTQAALDMRSTLTPIRRAACGFWATARIARPRRVRVKRKYSASMRLNEAPRMPSDTGASRAGPRVIGRLLKNDGNGNSSWLQIRPASARNTRESPSVMISTSQCAAPGARRRVHSPPGSRGARRCVDNRFEPAGRSTYRFAVSLDHTRPAAEEILGESFQYAARQVADGVTRRGVSARERRIGPGDDE